MVDRRYVAAIREAVRAQIARSRQDHDIVDCARLAATLIAIHGALPADELRDLIIQEAAEAGIPVHWG